MAKLSFRFTAPVLMLVSLLTYSTAANAGHCGWTDVVCRLTHVINGAGDRAIEARERAKEARDNIIGLREEIQARRADIAGNIRTTIEEGRDDLEFQIAQNIAGRREFLGIVNVNETPCLAGSPCFQFRADVVGLVNDLGTLSNSLFIATELEGLEIDSSKLTEVLNLVPPRALYPVYRALNQELNIFESPFVQKLNSTADALTFMKEAIPGTACEAMLTDRDRSAQLIRRTKVTAMGLQLVGKIFEAIGTKEISREGAIWGWVGFAIKNNRLKNIGIKFNAVGQGLGKYAGVASTKLLRCMIIDDHQQIMTSLGSLDMDLSNVDVATSTRASQASVDALSVNVSGLAGSIANAASQASVDSLAATLATLNTSGLDVPVSSRASQASVDALAGTVTALDFGDLDVPVSSRASRDSIDDLGEELTNHNAMAFQIEIERLLSEDYTPISAAYLPEAYGGSLERVREVVVNTMTQNEAAGISLGNAVTFFTQGEADRNVGAYKDAFKNYHKAYHAVVK